MEGYADLSDEDPDIIARLITFMYFGQHPHDMEVETACAFETSLAILLTRPEDDDAASTLPLEASLITALDKYQMPDVFVNGCKASYFCMIEEGLELCLSEPMVLEFIESLRIIYQGPPSAGLRGRAITTTQYNIGALQHRRDFRQLLLAIPELALDLATKGFQQRLWCTACSAYTEFILTFEDDLMVKTTQVWDLIDYGKPLDLTKFDCRNCSVTGKCVELAKETDDG